MSSRLAMPSRPDAWALGALGAGALAMAAATFAPFGPTRPDPASEPSIAMPALLGSPLADGYMAASPFDTARRPVDASARFAPAVDAQIVAIAVPEAPVRLAGILVEGEGRRVLFAGEAGWQGLGSSIGSWSVATVDPGLVTLRRGDETLTLRSLEALQR